MVSRSAAAGLASVAAAIVAQGTGAATPPTTEAVPRPDIVLRLIPFGATRRAETAAYAKRHYGTASWRLDRPRVIVEHYTATNSFASPYSYFASNTPDPELGERPGVCAHFLIDRDGAIYQLVRLNTMCRHTVGLNWTAFGVEHVGTSDERISATRRSFRRRSLSRSG